MTACLAADAWQFSQSKWCIVTQQVCAAVRVWTLRHANAITGIDRALLAAVERLAKPV
jgi:hypothetical protein